ncbi:hypothetical protein ABZW96_37110 [Nocardia sp. NPDC004168]|uniref:hypothetical protein n=1 Tax=Nocardia sp. NPDC004168 TaxID=3154452 RepID=UPI0033AE78B8
MNLIDFSYLDFNESTVRMLAESVRTFTDSVANTYASATNPILEMGSLLSSRSHAQWAEAWTEVASHAAELHRACIAAASSLDRAADLIAAAKVVVLTELRKLAVAYVGVMATPGAGAFELAIGEIARNLCNNMEEMLVSYLVEVIPEAFQPLEDTLAKVVVMATAVDAGHVLRAPPDGSRSLQMQAELELQGESAEFLRYAKMLDNLAGEIARHAATFVEDTARLDFTTRPTQGPGAP